VKLTSREAPSDLRTRIVGAGVAMVLAFAVIAARLFVLQVGQGQSWYSLSESNRIRVSRVPPTRGVVYDRNGEPIVDNRSSFDVVVTPEDAKDLEATIQQVSEFLGAEPPTMAQVLAAARQRPAYEATVIYRDVDFDKVVVPLETHRLEWPGVSLELGPLRTYPYGSLASHLLGYVGEVSQAELESRSDYRMGDLIGKFGAEKAFEALLRGVPGGQQIEVDALGRKLRVLSRVPETQGNSIVLTLDRRLQQFSEQLLEGREGAIAVLDPNTGGVLALASNPRFDPNVFAGGIAAKEWKRLTTDKLKPLNNRAIQGMYPPGSTFKIITAAAALETGVITPFTRIFCPGHYHFANRDYRCWKKGGHGSVDLHDAIVKSCDVYFYQVGQRLGVDTIAEYANRFGLGAPTGIELDHEKPGLIPSSEWKRKRFKEPWYAGETLSVAIGQGYVLATPLQMANAIAVVANGGTRYRPHYVSRVESPKGETVLRTSPEVVGEAGLRKTTLLQLRDALRDVVNSPAGTGKKAKLPTIEVGGKTGTSQVFKMGRQQIKTHGLPRHLRDHAWFVAFAPVEAPEIAIAVLVEHAGTGGGATAAPIAHDIADFYFSLTRGRTYQLAGFEVPAPAAAASPADAIAASGVAAQHLAPVAIADDERAQARRVGLAGASPDARPRAGRRTSSAEPVRIPARG
jgi:penicillin-binding protein 2